MALSLTACAGSGTPGPLDRFEATLARHASATAALGEWCAGEGIAAAPDIRAVPVIGQDRAPGAEVLAALGTEPGERIGYRHVRLMCGGIVLSQAHNWYVPARLTEAMNRTLETSDTPFGKVAAPLGYVREERPARRGRSASCPEGTVLTRGAILRLPDGRPISVVVECYTSAILAARPASRAS